jgi:hypothetical protein
MMIKGKNSFSRGPKKDTVMILDEDISLENFELEPDNTHGHYDFKKTCKRLSGLITSVYIFQGRRGSLLWRNREWAGAGLAGNCRWAVVQ